MRDILPDFFAKAIQIFNLRGVDPEASLNDVPSVESTLLARILDSTFGSNQKPLLAESLHRSGTEPGSILLNLSPHERAVLLAQALAGIILFLHTLASDTARRDGGQRAIARALKEEETRDESGGGSTGKKLLLETIEASPIFAECLNLKREVSELIRAAVEAQAERLEGGSDGAHAGRAGPRRIVVEDDSELQEISMSFVNDHRAPGDVVLPCGLTILPLN